jgi:hypothetical protein
MGLRYGQAGVHLVASRDGSVSMGQDLAFHSAYVCIHLHSVSDRTDGCVLTGVGVFTYPRWHKVLNCGPCEYSTCPRAGGGGQSKLGRPLIIRRFSSAPSSVFWSAAYQNACGATDFWSRLQPGCEQSLTASAQQCASREKVFGDVHSAFHETSGAKCDISLSSVGNVAKRHVRLRHDKPSGPNVLHILALKTTGLPCNQPCTSGDRILQMWVPVAS